jgi:hypothetical protein
LLCFFLFSNSGWGYLDLEAADIRIFSMIFVQLRGGLRVARFSDKRWRLLAAYGFLFKLAGGEIGGVAGCLGFCYVVFPGFE